MPAISTIKFRGVMAGLRSTRKRCKASDYLREHVARFNKSSATNVRIDPTLNDFIMSRIVKRGKSVQVDVTKSGDIINVKLAPGQVPAAPDAGKNSPPPTPPKQGNNEKPKPPSTKATPAQEKGVDNAARDKKTAANIDQKTQRTSDIPKK